jgi:hypothetical protein
MSHSNIRLWAKSICNVDVLLFPLSEHMLTLEVCCWACFLTNTLLGACSFIGSCSLLQRKCTNIKMKKISTQYYEELKKISTHYFEDFKVSRIKNAVCSGMFTFSGVSLHKSWLSWSFFCRKVSITSYAHAQLFKEEHNFARRNLLRPTIFCTWRRMRFLQSILHSLCRRSRAPWQEANSKNQFISETGSKS